MGDGVNMIDILQTGLRATGTRGKVLANNIANINTPGYRRRAVAFEKALSEAMASGDAEALREVTFETLQPRNTPVGANGNDVDLDSEVGDLIKNSALRKTYIRLLHKVYRQAEMAIQTNK
ncbi:MAG: flagellar basal body rod protein FlgB [Phycisphaerae bacterium]|nr:flagellar basal body rod protein FlgB [Phycisphaerae bacterium]